MLLPFFVGLHVPPLFLAFPAASSQHIWAGGALAKWISSPWIRKGRCNSVLSFSGGFGAKGKEGDKNSEQKILPPRQLTQPL